MTVKEFQQEIQRLINNGMVQPDAQVLFQIGTNMDDEPEYSTVHSDDITVEYNDNGNEFLIIGA